MAPPGQRLRRPAPGEMVRSALAAILILLGACGGGRGGELTGLTGQALETPLPGATITLTLGAPLGQNGARTLATTTAGNNGAFTLVVPLPSSNTPVFANTQEESSLLSSFLGPANMLGGLSRATPALAPDIVINQTTAAALSILASTGSVASLTPTLYAILLSQHRSDMLAAAARIMAAVDSECPLLPGDGTDIANPPGTPGLTASCNAVLQTLLLSVSAVSSRTSEIPPGRTVKNRAPTGPAGRPTLQGSKNDPAIPATSSATSGGSDGPPPAFDTGTAPGTLSRIIPPLGNGPKG